MLSYGKTAIDPPLILAPMAGITDRYFRLILRRIGGVGLVSMEFVSSEAMTRGNRRTLAMMHYSEEERPLAIQIYGSRPERMAEAAQMVEEMGAEVCDVNMGCPANKVLKGCAGAALMRDPAEAERIIAAIRKRISIPLTVKFRSGIGKGATPVNFLELGRVCEANGVDAVTLHPRTARQLFTGQADWNQIRELKEALSIPVVGNGDVRCAEDVPRMFEETGCDAVMIGRATLKNPWIFLQAAALLRGEGYEAPTLEQRRDLILGHFRMLQEEEPEEKMALHKMRTFLGWYTRGLPGGRHLRRKINDLKSSEEVLEALEAFFGDPVAA
jgi:nifR3 family TIM-barrel protein